jgi:ABC-type transport system involved in multi-copper enzyme maturation permease subunit
MTWLAWRQFRTQAWTALAGLAVIAVLLAVTGPHLAHLYDTSGIPGCQGHRSCSTLITAFDSQVSASRLDGLLTHLGAIVIAAPALAGMFWGAPLVARELESGTHRLVWTQSISRSHWLTVKLALTGLASMTAAGLLSLMLTWWSGPIDLVNDNRLTPGMFIQRGIAPIGYAALAFALGVTAGALTRRVVPAMAITLAAVIAIQIGIPQWLQPHLQAPARTTFALTTATLAVNNVNTITRTITLDLPTRNIPGAWILSDQTVTASGHPFTGPVTRPCLTGSMQDCASWLAALHLRQAVTYQPASRYWTFQWYETGICVVLASILAGFCCWWVRRRIS